MQQEMHFVSCIMQRIIRIYLDCMYSMLQYYRTSAYFGSRNSFANSCLPNAFANSMRSVVGQVCNIRYFWMLNYCYSFLTTEPATGTVSILPSISATTAAVAAAAAFVVSILPSISCSHAQIKYHYKVKYQFHQPVPFSTCFL